MSETSVLIKVGFDGALALVGLTKVKESFTRIGSEVDKVRAKHKAMADELRAQRQALRSDALDAIGIGATAFIPVKLAINFESAMADVKKVVDFDTPDGFQKLTNEILRMSRYLPLSVEQLAQIAASGGQLGVAAKDIPSFVETVAKMSTAFDMAAEDAGDSMAKLANVYNIPIAKIGQLGDAINQLSNESPAKASDIVRTLGRIGGVAKAFGLTELQAASLSNALISLGKAPEVAGTSINGMLTKLVTADKQGAKFQSALRQIGLSASSLKRAIKQDAEGALMGFLQALERVPTDRRMGVLVDLFGLEYADDVAVLAGSVKTYASSIATLNSSRVSGSMDKEFAARAATTANNLTLLKNGLTEIGINIGSAVLPALNDLVNTVRPVVGAVAAWAKEHPKLMSALVMGVAGFAAVKLGAIGVAYGFNLVKAGWNGLMLGFNMLRAVAPVGGAILRWVGSGIMGVGRFAVAAWPMVMAFGRGLAMTFTGPLMLAGKAVLFLGRALLMNPIGLLVTGVAVAGYLIYKHWGAISKFFTELAGKFKAWGSAMIDGLVGGIQARFQAAKAAVVGMATNIKGWFTDVLGIRSPSRVFMGFGANIGEGAQIGISRSIGKVAQASGRLAQAARGAIAGAAMAGAAGAGAAGTGGMVIHYSPNITVQGGAAGEVVPAVQQALKLSEREFEQMLNRTLAQRQRRNF